MDIAKSSPPERTGRMGRRDWHTRAALPMLAWMVTAIGLVGGHRFVPRATWLLVHLVTLGIASNAIVVWSNHFADAVLRSARRDHRREVSELGLLNGGLLLLVAGVVAQWRPVVWAGVACLVLMAGVAVVGLGRQARRSLPARFAVTVRWYQVASACLVVGAVLGGLMAVPYGRWADGLLAAHLALNALGWVGLTAVGTLTSLWPTMLRTQAPAGAERTARRSLALMTLGVLGLAGAMLLHPLQATAWRLVASLAVASYLVGLCLHLGQAGRAWWHKPGTSFPVLSAGLAQLWLLGWTGWLLAHQLVAQSPAALVVQVRDTVPALVVGFLLQLVMGALAYLVPVVLGGGPALVRGTNAVMDRGAVARVATVNLGLAVFLLPIPSVWKVTASSVVFVALALFLPLLVRAWWLRRRGVARDLPVSTGPGRLVRGAAWGLAWTLLAAALAAAVDPASFRALGHRSPSQGVAASTGHTTRVRVVAHQMRFTPDVVDVPAGDRLVVTVVNTDPTTVHDLVLETGATSGRVAPGASATMDAGVVSATTDGWCSVAGHRQMGMGFTVRVAGASGRPGSTGSAVSPSTPSLAPGASWPKGFRATPASLPPAGASRVHRVTLEVRDTVVTVAPGVQQTLWTWNGQAPGPVLRGRVGDVFDVTLVNHATMGHSLDFHAGALAPDRPMRTIAPGQRLRYRFTATRAGVWMYHCSTAPMSLHIANGMYGAVVIDPPDLPRVDREFLLVQGELYFGAPGSDGTPGVADARKVRARTPDAVVFNGRAFQYDADPLLVSRGERVRFWVLDAGPDASLAFHVVGAQFDSVWAEGAWRLRGGRTPGVAGGSGGSQTLGLLASQGGFVETRFTEAGRYPMVNHQMSDAETGAHGVVTVR